MQKSKVKSWHPCFPQSHWEYKLLTPRYGKGTPIADPSCAQYDDSYFSLSPSWPTLLKSRFLVQYFNRIHPFNYVDPGNKKKSPKKIVGNPLDFYFWFPIRTCILLSNSLNSSMAEIGSISKYLLMSPI